MCIFPFEICDGVNHCVGGDDELHCKAPLCPSNCNCLGFAAVCKSFLPNEFFQVNDKVYLKYFELHMDLVNQFLSDQFHNNRFLIMLNLTSNSFAYVCSDQETGFKNPFFSLRNLHVLDVSSNKITILLDRCFETNIFLRELYVRRNNINDAEASCFVNLRMLRMLDLSENAIGKIHKDLFRDLFSLKYLNVMENPILHIETDLGMTGLQEIFTEDYRFCCLATVADALCTAKRQWFSTCEDLLEHLAMRIIVWFIAIISFVFNIISFIVKARVILKKTSVSYSIMIACLALSDFCFSLYLVSIACADVYYRGNFILHQIPWRQSFMCTLLSFLSYLSLLSSNVILLTITLVRLIVVLFPLNIKFKSKEFISKLLGFLTFILVCFCSIVHFHTAKSPEKHSNTMCLYVIAESPSLLQEIAVYTLIILNTFSVVFIPVAYGSINHIISIRNEHIQDRAGRLSGAYVSLSMQIILVMFSNVACWVPTVVICILTLLGYEIGTVLIKWMVILILPINCAINPLVFTVLSSARKENSVGSDQKPN